MYGLVILDLGRRCVSGKSQHRSEVLLKAKLLLKLSVLHDGQVDMSVPPGGEELVEGGVTRWFQHMSSVPHGQK